MNFTLKYFSMYLLRIRTFSCVTMSSDGIQDGVCDPEFYDLFKYGRDSIATYIEPLLCARCHPLHGVFKLIRETSQ